MIRKLPKYCRECGAELNVSEAKNVKRGYDEFTGKPRIINITSFRCPNEHSAFDEFDKHDIFSFETVVDQES